MRARLISTTVPGSWRCTLWKTIVTGLAGWHIHCFCRWRGKPSQQSRETDTLFPGGWAGAVLRDWPASFVRFISSPAPWDKPRYRTTYNEYDFIRNQDAPHTPGRRHAAP